MTEHRRGPDLNDLLARTAGVAWHRGIRFGSVLGFAAGFAVA